MHTLAVFHTAEPSGAAISLRGRLEWLAGQGRLTAVFPGEGLAADHYRGLARVDRLPYAAMTLPAGAPGLPGALVRLRRETAMFRAYLLRERPDLVVASSAMLPALLLATRLEGVPAIVHAAEVLVRDPTRHAAARMSGWALARATRRLANGIAACSQAVAREYLPGPPAVAITYPPIEPGCDQADGAGFRRAIGVDPTAPLIAAVGSVTRRRGQDVLVRAIKIASRALPEVRCAIVGDAFPRPQDLAYRSELIGLIERLGLGGRVVMAGARDDVRSVCAAADVFVNPARVAESFGRGACEALVCGCPVVSSRVGAVPEVLSDGRTALLVPPGRPGPLADRVLELLRRPDQARELATRGGEDVRSRFGGDAALREFQGLVSDVLVRTRRPACAS